jgi:catechol 2,3-dioxygenase-like lactoylglutathione lyase family enzyme
MKARIHVITLAVADFERALAFYRALGFQSVRRRDRN